MDEFNKNDRDEASSYDEIQDFDFFKIEEDKDRIVEVGEDDYFYRSLDEY